MIYDGLTIMKVLFGNVDPLEGKDLLKEHCNRVQAVPEIADWVANRP